MTDTADQPGTELATIPDPPSRAPAKADTDSWVQVMASVSRLAEIIGDTEFVPRSLRGNPAAVTAAIVAGREAGLPPMAALTQTHVVNGVPSLSAKAKRALVLAAGHEVEVLEASGEYVSVRARRRGSGRWSAEVVWTMDMARAAGLHTKDNWKHHPRQMLVARATGELLDREFPDVVFGFETTEQVDDDVSAGVLAASTPEAETTPVKRAAARRGRKATASRPAPAADRPAAPQGPPLPGEDDSAGVPDPAPAPQAAQAPDSPPAPDLPEPAPPAAEPDPAPDRREPPEGVQVDEVEARRSGRPVGRGQHRLLFSQLGRLGISTDDDDRDARLAIVSSLVGRPVESTNKLTSGEATALIDTLARFETAEQLREFVDALEIDRAHEAPDDDPDAAVDPETDEPADVVDADVVEDDAPEGDQ